MTNPLVVLENGKNRESSLIGLGLAGWGMANPSRVSGSPVQYVWILSSTLPQEFFVRAIWTTSDVWECSNVWYK